MHISMKLKYALSIGLALYSDSRNMVVVGGWVQFILRHIGVNNRDNVPVNKKMFGIRL